MGKESRWSSSHHQMFKDKARNRVDDLQGMFTDLQFARRESRTGDVVILEEQVHQMLREWRAELNQSSPTSSLHEASRVSSDLSSDIRRLLQLCEEEDDATSKLAEIPQMKPEPAPEPEPVQVRGGPRGQQGAEAALYHEGYFASQVVADDQLQGMEGSKSNALMESNLVGMDSFDGTTHLDFQRFNMHQELSQDAYAPFDVSGPQGLGAPDISDLLPTISPPASAFLKPKCSLWDCPRPAKGTDWFEDYCSSIHAILALNEGPPGMTPVLRPGGIDLKDGPLFAALTAKTEGKNVGIPECEGAATAKSPWNAPELFDLAVLEGESIREWLFFDKPRRAFESGNRKQRSLPDYNGRGWHESRKQVLKEYGGLKRSYYMDPQPLNNFEWHLYEYEINNCDACALYRLEFKLVDAKKGAKGKVYGVIGASLVDPQQQHQMGKPDSESPLDTKRSSKGRSKVSLNDATASDMYSGRPKEEDIDLGTLANQASVAGNEGLIYGPHLPYGYSVENLHLYYGT